MISPSEFTEHLEVGDTIEWRAETRDVRPTKHTVIEIQEDQAELKLLVEGARGDQYRLLIRQDGGTDVYYLRPRGEEEYLGPLTEITIYGPSYEYSHSW